MQRGAKRAKDEAKETPLKGGVPSSTSNIPPATFAALTASAAASHSRPALTGLVLTRFCRPTQTIVDPLMASPFPLRPSPSRYRPIAPSSSGMSTRMSTPHPAAAETILTSLWNDASLSDVVVSTPGGPSHSLHRLILAASSPVLAALIAPLPPDPYATFTVPDTTPAALAAVLAHIYAQAPPIPLPSLVDTWSLADRLGLDVLAAAARNGVRDGSKDDVYDVLRVAKSLGDGAVVAEAYAAIAGVIGSGVDDDFFALTLEDVEGVLKARPQRRGAEGLSERFETCLKWCEARPGRRVCLDRLCLQISLGEADLDDVESIVRHAGDGSVLMWNIVVGPLRREAGERKRLETRVEALLESQEYWRREELALLEKVKKLEREVEGLREGGENSKGAGSAVEEGGDFGRMLPTPAWIEARVKGARSHSSFWPCFSGLDTDVESYAQLSYRDRGAALAEASRSYFENLNGGEGFQRSMWNTDGPRPALLDTGMQYASFEADFHRPFRGEGGYGQQPCRLQLSSFRESRMPSYRGYDDGERRGGGGGMMEGCGPMCGDRCGFDGRQNAMLPSEAYFPY